MARVEECDLFQVCATGNATEFETLYRNDSSILYQKIPALQETSLHLASRYNHEVLVSKILQLDARLFVQYILNKDEHSALFVACSCERLEVALILCDKMDFNVWDGIGASCLWLAASKGYQGVVQKILSQNLSLASRKDENGFSALHLAAREGKTEVIKELLGIDGKLSFLRENDGRTPLHLAVANRKVVAVEEFLSGSTELNDPGFRFTDLINIADNDGNTLLHHAATVDFSEILGTLVNMEGIDVNAVNKQGMTALDILQKQPASTPERERIIEQLEGKKGANPISVTPVQQTLMVVAALVCTITFHAGLNPPGGFWPDSNGTNQTDHKPGKAIQSTTNPWFLVAFTVFDALAFTAAASLIPIIFVLPKTLAPSVTLIVVAALFYMLIAFVLGLIMVSDGLLYTAIQVVAGTLPFTLGVMPGAVNASYSWFIRRLHRVTF